MRGLAQVDRFSLNWCARLLAIELVARVHEMASNGRVLMDRIGTSRCITRFVAAREQATTCDAEPLNEICRATAKYVMSIYGRRR